MGKTIDVAILTPLELEADAVLEHLDDIQEYEVRDRICDLGVYKGKEFAYNVLVYQTGSKNTNVALAATAIAEKVEPSLMLTVGIAGGVKDVNLGDIVVATKAYGYESGKITDAGHKARPSVFPFDVGLMEVAKRVKRDEKWKSAFEGDTPPKIYQGPIAAGDKVIASTKAEVYDIIKDHYNDTTALEMEAVGFAEAMQRFPRVRIMNFRAISDMLKDKAEMDEQGSQTVAAKNAAAYTFAFLHRLNLDKYSLQKDKSVNVNELATQNDEALISTPKASFQQDVKLLIANEKFRLGLEKILKYTQHHDKDLYNHAIMTSGQWNGLQRQVMMGTISQQDANVSQNRVRQSLLYIIDEL